MQDVLEAVKRQPEDGVLYAQTEGIEPPEILLLFLRAFSAGAEDPRARSLHVIAPNP